MYRTRQTLYAPQGLPMGQLIGKGGSNVKHIQSRSGARVNVNSDAGVVSISGSTLSVSTAVQLFEGQFASWRSSGTSAVFCLDDRGIGIDVARAALCCWASETPTQQDVGHRFNDLACKRLL